MKFRKLYWVTEQLDANGQSEVIGVYTSIFDLRSKGLRWDADTDKKAVFRINLVKLDSTYKPFGTWSSPQFDGLQDGLQHFVDTGEFDAPSCEQLVADLATTFGSP